MLDYIVIGFIILFFLTVITILLRWLYIRWGDKSNKGVSFVVLRIKVPQYSTQEKDKENKEYIQNSLGQIENFFTVLSGLKAQRKIRRTDLFSIELVSDSGIINIYAAMPPSLKDFFVEHLQSVYPHIHYEEVSDYNIFQPNGVILAGSLRFARDYSLPIRTYRKFENDPMESITNALSKLNENEGAAIQYVFRSSKSKWHSRGRKIAQHMHRGLTYNEALKKAGGGGGFFNTSAKIFGFFIDFFTTRDPNKEKEKTPEPQPLSAMEQERAKGMEEKTAKSGLDVNIRMVVSTPSKERSTAILSDIMNSFSQYNIYEFGNSFKIFLPRNIDTYVEHFIYRHFVPQNSMLLNSEEMTSVVHLPIPGTHTPNIDWLGAVEAAPPTNMPTEGIILGLNTYRGKKTVVRIKDEDRRRHMYEIGQTGTGKSVFLESLVIQDIEAGRGVCVLDPHGDLVEKVLAHIPKERAEDVILFDPSDVGRPMGMNMLEFETEEQKSFVINEMIAIFDKLYDLKATGGPMFEQYMRNAMLLIMEDKESGATLLEIPKVLSDSLYRKQKLEKVKNYLVRDFWEKEAQKAGGEASLANMVPYITSKLTPFLSNDLIRPIVSQEKSAFNFRKAMDEDKIILVNLSKGKIGDMNSSLLGMIVIGKILYAALSRVDMPEDQRKDFYLYIDEFQNYITDSISVILSEARKYKLNLILAHQFLAQLVKNNDTRIKDAVFGNVGTIISYRIGVDDAEVIAKQMAPVVSEYDLLNMPKYTCYVKLLIDNQNPPAFNFMPVLPEKGNYELAKTIKELSRLKYGRDKQVVENEIRIRSNIVADPPKVA
ncbi:type IV secretion system DNA-binding domain-containing protein [Patescibacteria group bacterium]|nr:type IV secretion system DNA-binding domain-containing protein [Patescibacteria group bacterium]